MEGNPLAQRTLLQQQTPHPALHPEPFQYLQGVFFNMYFIVYLLWPKVCHAFVGECKAALPSCPHCKW